MQSWVLASGNKGKLTEFSELFEPLQIKILSQSDLGVSPCDEPFETFLENALHKARHASQHAQLPALADDSGICVPALNGAPGVYSARFAQRQGFSLEGETDTDRVNSQALVAELAKSSPALLHHWSAYYICVLVLVRHPQDPAPLVAQATWWGELHKTPQGNNGFGYDPYFYLPDQGCTVAQLATREKNRLSHRAKAMQILLEQWRLCLA